MTLLVAALVPLALARPPEIRAVRLTTIDFRPALRVLTSDDAPPGTLAREGGELVIRLTGSAPAELTLPEVETPLEGIRVEREEAATVLRVTLPPEVPYEVSHEPGMLTVVFGEAPSPGARGPVTPGLYQRLFPTGVVEREPVADEEADTFSEEGPQGIALGRVILQPYATVSYVDADVLAFDDPEPVGARYLQVAPGVTATTPLLGGRFAAEYEPRLRFFSDIPEIGTTSHLAGARFDVPVGSRTLLRVGHRYTRAVLETTVVDPGREYFFDLSPYSFHDTTAQARVEVGPTLVVDFDGGVQRTRFDHKDAGYFDYDRRVLRAGLGYDLRSDLRATVSYVYDDIPTPPQRLVAQSRAHNVVATLEGEITPLTAGAASVGLRRQTSPLASNESRSFTGLTLRGALRRQLGYRSTLGLEFRRSTEPSAFEDNAFYVTNQVVVSLDVPVPLALWARGSAGFLRNDYPTESSSTGEERTDDVWLWTIGVGRQLGWRSWVRADYRRETRRSNVPGLDVTTDGFVLQVGIGQGAVR